VPHGERLAISLPARGAAREAFVEIVPKTNWGKFMLDNASDVGFLRVDLQRREVLFEGDQGRFRLPAEAITGCGVEYYVQGEGTAGATKMYFVVLRADQATGLWEAPIRERGGTGLFTSRRRLRRMTALAEAVNRIRSKTLNQLTQRAG